MKKKKFLVSGILMRFNYFVLKGLLCYAFLLY